VKLLGDGAMVAFHDVVDAVGWAQGFVGSVEREGLPPVHIGVDAGRFVRRDGDFFGSVVNVASRLAGEAHAGEVLVTERVAERASAVQGPRFEPAGLRTLKNVATPIQVFRVAGGADLL
jgi:adenylate cyclase